MRLGRPSPLNSVVFATDLIAGYDELVGKRYWGQRRIRVRHNHDFGACVLRYISLALILVLLFPVTGRSDESKQGDGQKQVKAHHHAHKQIEVSSFQNIPKLSLEVSRDAVGGWNIHIIPEHFRFTPENVNKAPTPGEGHAHLYVDGKKIARLYSAWFHLGSLAPGPHTIRVTLNANNHADLVLNGKPVAVNRDIVQ